MVSGMSLSGARWVRYLALLLAVVGAGDTPGDARQQLRPVIAALRAIEYPPSGRGSGLVKIQDAEGYHEHRFQFRFKGDRLSRTDWFGIQDIDCAKRQFAWSMGSDAYVGCDEREAVVQREPAKPFHHEFGYDFHPATFASPGGEPLATTLQRWVDGPADLAVDFDDNGLVEIRREHRDIQGSDMVERQVLILDKENGFRPVFFQHTWSPLNAEKFGRGIEKRVSWRRYGQAWYISDAKYKRLKVGPYIKDELPDIVDSSQEWVKVDVMDVALNVDVADSEFTLDGLSLPDGHRVVDHIAGTNYRHETTSAATGELVSPPEEQGSLEDAESNQAPGPWENFGKPAASLEGLQWIKGGPIRIEKGSVYIVEFWSMWTAACWASIPHLTDLQHRYRDKGVTIIGICPETAEEAIPFVEGKRDTMDYAVAIDPNRKVAQGYMDAFGVEVIPHAFIIGKSGTVLWHGHAMARIDDVLQQILADGFDDVTYARRRAAEAKEQTRLARLRSEYFTLLGRDDHKARHIAQQIVTDAHATASGLNILAWGILTGVSPEDRDLELARQAAARAVELSGHEDAAVLDTYALALYELGKAYVAEAVTHQKRAVALTEYDGLRAKMEETLKRYESAALE